MPRQETLLVLEIGRALSRILRARDLSEATYGMASDFCHVIHNENNCVIEPSRKV